MPHIEGSRVAPLLMQPIQGPAKASPASPAKIKEKLGLKKISIFSHSVSPRDVLKFLTGKDRV